MKSLSLQIGFCYLLGKIFGLCILMETNTMVFKIVSAGPRINNVLNNLYPVLLA